MKTQQCQKENMWFVSYIKLMSSSSWLFLQEKIDKWRGQSMQKLLRGLQSNELGQCVVSGNISFHVLTAGHPGVCLYMCVRLDACMYARSQV